MGRTVRYGVIHVGDAPLSQAQEGRRAVSVLDALRKHADLGVRRVGLNDVERGPPGIERGVGALLAEGLTLIAFDATANEHLASISAVLARRYPDGLAVGSAGLAYALAAELVARGAERATRVLRSSPQPPSSSFPGAAAR